MNVYTSLKRASFLLFLMQISSFAWAECRPWEAQLSDDTLKGCGEDWQLYKMRNVQINFPDGYSERRTPDGHGSCGQSTSCDALTGFIYILKGVTECWPQFDTPRIEEGSWSQTVRNQLAVQNLSTCGGSLFAAGPIACVDHPTVLPHTTTVPHSCPTSVGDAVPLPDPWMPAYDAPCTWGFEPGLPPCWERDPTNK
jgi:hypothetical protein